MNEARLQPHEIRVRALLEASLECPQNIRSSVIEAVMNGWRKAIAELEKGAK